MMIVEWILALAVVFGFNVVILKPFLGTFLYYRRVSLQHYVFSSYVGNYVLNFHC